MTKRLVVLGAGGHAKVAIATARLAGFAVQAVLDDDPSLTGSSVLGVPVTGPIDRSGVPDGAMCVLAIGANAPRKEVADRMACRWASIVHPQAVVDPSAEIGDGAVVFAGVVVQPEAVIGAHAILNTGCSVDHDCRVGSFAHLAPGVRLAGGCSVAQGAFLGIGAVMIPGTEVGAWSTVGAGAAVVGNIADGVIAVGVPARAIERAE